MMKKIILLLCVLCAVILNPVEVQAQVPNQFNYQAVARNSVGQSIPNANIRTKFTILDGSATGTNVYSEIRVLTTNQLGLFTAAIGGSGAINVTGNFATIDWSTGKKFIKVEVDPLGGTNFIALGNTEMLSVPYALYAVNGKVGPQGPPNVLNVGTVTTGATGTAASATITGTSPAQTINLVLPTGANGKISLVKTTAEAAGANCTAGGNKIENGVDLNNNNILEPAEVTNTAYTCNGDVTNAWKTTGNAGTTASNFIGTTDVKPFIIKTNNNEALRIDANGNVGIGTNAPSSKLAVISSSTQPLVNVNNTGSGPLSYGINAGSQDGVGIYGISQNGRAVVGFNNNATQPTAEFTNTTGAALKVNGAVAYKVNYTTTNYTLTDNDYILFCDMENIRLRKITVNLPTPTALREGRVYSIIILNAPTTTTTDLFNPGGTGFVQVNGNFGSDLVFHSTTIFNIQNSKNRLFNVEESLGFPDPDYKWIRTKLTYICVNSQWLKLEDNQFMDIGDLL
jgi:hypothetical protein